MRMKYVFLGVLLLLYSSCAWKTKGVAQTARGDRQLQVADSLFVTDTTYIDGELIELLDHNGAVELRVNTKVFKIHSGEIGMNPPAYFLKRDSALLLFNFPEIGVEKIFMIAGGVKYMERDLPIRVKQVQALQGYVLNKHQLYPTKYFNFHTPVDFDNGADGIFYTDLAYDFYKKNLK